MRSMRKGYFTPPVLIILAIIIFAVAILIAINTDLVKRIKKEPTPTPITSPSPTTQQPSPTPDETANWKTYKNQVYGFEIKIPPTWHILAEGKIDEYNNGCFEPAGNDDTVGFSKPDIRNDCLGDNLVGAADIGITGGHPFVTFEDAYKRFEKIYFAGEKAARFYEEADYKSPYRDMTIALIHNNQELWIRVNNGQAMLNRNENIEQITNTILSTFKFLE